MKAMMELYDRVVDPRLLVRRVNIAAVNLVSENAVPEETPKGVVREQISLFDNPELDSAEEKKDRDRKAAEEKAEEKERKLQKATLAMQEKYGKNAILKGTNFLEGATTRERNMQIGGHRSGEGDEKK